MKRVIFDTNIYGRMVENNELRYVVEASENILTVYGSVIINRELRNYEGITTLEFEGRTRKLRSLLFEAYNLLVKDRIYPLDDKTDRLAEGYFLAYQKFGGKKDQSSIINDFLIAAIASLHRLEIIYSDDSKTMKSEEAQKAYELVNSLHNLAAPQFKSYQELIKELKQTKRWSS